MNRLLVAASALALSASLASAADLPARNLPARQAPVILPLFTWTGFYVGLQGGGGWTRDRFSETATCPSPCSGVDGLSETFSRTGNGSGVLGGPFVGYNFQFGSMVAGVEADISATSIEHSTFVPESEPDTFKSRLRWEASVRARLGYAIDRVLLYVTGGVAFADIRHTYERFDETASGSGVYQFTASQSFSHQRTGWTLGAGVEYAFAPNWSARLEYRYSDFGKTTDRPTLYVAPPTYTSRHDETFHTVRFGVAYRF